MRNLAFILLLIAASAMAQQRPVAVPSDAQVARMTYVEATHSVDLDGVREQLSPGAQIRDQSNRIIVPAAMPPDSVVCYQRDTAGLVHRVWILTPEEAAQRR